MSGTKQSSNSAILLHESSGRGDLALRFGSVHARQFYAIRHGPIQSIRVEQSSSMPGRDRSGGESIYYQQ